MKKGGGKPIAYDAYEKLAEHYAARIDTKAENAHCERPGILALMPAVRGKRILDAGCGPGTYTQWLVEQGAVAVGVDVSPKMVELARRKVGKRAEIRLVDLRQPLDFFEDRSLDGIMSSLVVHYIEDWDTLFGEFYRILKSPGFMVLSAGHPYTDFNIAGGEDYFSTELVIDTWRGFGIPVEMPSYRRSLEDMVTPMANAGFVIDRITEPRPTETCRQQDPRAYDRLSKRPGFICLRLLKR
jgi:SAM-dependent methyltransferase